MLNIQENVSLQPYNTFGVAVQARFFVTVDDESRLLSALEWAQAEDQPLLLLGGGSNMLFTKDWEGLVIKLELRGREIAAEDDDQVAVRFAAGENWHESVLWTVEQGWGGIENLSLIPGQIGTAPIQNIGAYGVEVKDTIVSVEAVSIDDRVKKVFNNKDCQFGYRDSVFKRAEKGKWIITAVTFKLAKTPVLNLSYGAIQETLRAQNVENPTVADISQAVIAIRQSKLPDPKEIGNGGSFFKNPVVEDSVVDRLRETYPEMPFYEVKKAVSGEQRAEYKIPAAWLIDTAGWKGHRAGNVGVHDRQALVLVNHGGGTGAEVWALAQEIQADVESKFGIRLEPEINII